MSRAAKAVADLKAGFSCSQAVLAAFAEDLGLDVNLARRIAGGFGGGMGRLGLTCGAVTGAMMVIGLKHGAASAADLPAKQKTQQLVREFMQQFTARHESLACRDLLGADISTPEGSERIKQENLIANLCPGFVTTAVEILDELVQR